MPRFVARPLVVEAHQYDGHTHMLPEAFRLAVRRHLQGGSVEVMTSDGARACSHGDWIVRGPDGDFSVLRQAVFEAWFEDFVPPSSRPPEIVRRAYNRKETVNA